MKKPILFATVFFFISTIMAQFSNPFQITGKIFTLQHSYRTSAGTQEYRFYKVALGSNPIPIIKNREVSLGNLAIYDEQSQKTCLVLAEKDKRNQFHEYSHKEKKLRYDLKEFEFLSEEIHVQFILDVLLYELVARETSTINKNLNIDIRQNTKDIYEIQIEKDSSNSYIISGLASTPKSFLSVRSMKDFPSYHESFPKVRPVSLDIKGKQFKMIIPVQGRTIRYKFAISSHAFITQSSRNNGTSIHGIMFSDYQTRKAYLATNVYYVCDKNKSNEIKHLTLSSYSSQLSDNTRRVIDVVLYGILSQRFMVEKKQDHYIVRDSLGNFIYVSEIGNAPEYIFRENSLCDF